MKFLSALFFAAAAVAPVAADTGKTEPASIIDLAAADGKYGTLLAAVTNTPGVLDAVIASFPVSKYRFSTIVWFTQGFPRSLWYTFLYRELQPSLDPSMMPSLRLLIFSPHWTMPLLPEFLRDMSSRVSSLPKWSSMLDVLSS